MDSSFEPEAAVGSPETTIRPGALDAAIGAMSDGWAAGDRPRAEGFADRVADAGRAGLLELVYHEFCLAEAAGDEPEPADYLARFPSLYDDFARLIGLHGAVDRSTLWSMAGGSTDLPEPGDEIGPYRLLRELGKGGMARVFLAEQVDLEDRLVVVKVASRPSLEAILLARAEHPHIVRLLRQAEGGGLHLIVMPFVGGATLAAVLAEGAGRGGRRSGRGLLAALDRVAAPEFAAADARSATRDLLAGLSHAKAVAWMMARLAEALEHANRLGVTHGDLKPANVLIAADGQPMLLDFNLAVDWRSADAEIGGAIGGTLAYMAPERLRALADPKSSPPTRPADRHRADLYAMGLVLREALSGRSPEPPRDRHASIQVTASRLAEARARAEPSAWSRARGVPASLRPILARLLAPDPAARYAGMGELAEDLNRWGADRRLLHAREEPGPGRRVARWASRRRVPLLAGAVVLAVAAVVAFAANARMNRRLRAQAEAKLAALWDSGDPAIFRARRFGQWRLDDDAAGLARQNLDHYAVLGPDDWRRREDVRALGGPDRADLEMWLMEQTWRLASSWAARPDSRDDWRRAVSLLERSPEWAALDAFEALRRSLHERLGEPPAPSRDGSPRWLESYAAGLQAEAGEARAAARHYEAVLDERPGALWPLYRASVMASRLNDHRAAADFLALCLDRRPRNPALWTLRAGCLLVVADERKEGRPRDPTPAAAPESWQAKAEEALLCCDRALAIDPDFRDAYLVRCVTRARLNLIEGQEADASRLARLSRSRGGALTLGLSLTLSNLAGLGGPIPEATEDVDIQALIAGQLHRAGRTDAALAAYDRVLAADPDHLSARYGRASLLRSQRRNEGASEFAVLIEHPRFEELIRLDPTMLRAIHMVVRYRLLEGAVAEARRLAERALRLARELGPPGGPESPLVAESKYYLARVLVQGAAEPSGCAIEVADLLEQAGRANPDILHKWFPRDRSFDAARPAIVARLAALREAEAAPGASLPVGSPRDAPPHRGERVQPR